MVSLENVPQAFDDNDDDEVMADVPTSEVGSPPPKDEDDEDEEHSEAEDEDGSPARESEPGSGPGSPVAEQPVIIRRKRLGRPPKNRPADWDQGVEVTSDMGTPAKRGGRGRGGFRGAKYGRRGGPSHVTQQPIDKEGNMMDVIDDEVVLPEDEEGEAKVDKFGNLKGDRKYRCRTYSSIL